MPTTSPPSRLETIVGRLRAAGCVFAEDEAALLIAAAHTPAKLGALVARRVAGLPLEQVIGRAEFCGLEIAVGPGVFVPRRRTEHLVAQAVRGRAPGPATIVVDLCCGSGALGVAVASGLGDRQVELHAADIDPGAIRWARRNVEAAGGRVYEGDLFEPLPAELRGRVDIVLANAPYVPTEEIALLPPEARLHEPLVSLDGGADGLDVLRRVIAAAPQWLAPGGRLLVETTQSQRSVLLDAVAAAGLTSRTSRSARLDATVVIATRRGRPSGGKVAS